MNSAGRKKKGLIVGVVLLSLVAVIGCGDSKAEKKRRYEQKVAAEQAKLEEEAKKPSMDALPTADAEGKDFDSLPRPPKSFRLSTNITVKGGTPYGSVGYVSTAELDELIDFFKNELKNKGWAFKNESKTSMKGLPGALLNFEKDNLRGDIDIEKAVTEKQEDFYRVTIKQFEKL